MNLLLKFLMPLGIVGGANCFAPIEVHDLPFANTLLHPVGKNSVGISVGMFWLASAYRRGRKEVFCTGRLVTRQLVAPSKKRKTRENGAFLKSECWNGVGMEV